MRIINAGVAALRESGRTDSRGLIEIRLSIGTYYFVKDIEPRVWNGNTYVPGGWFDVSEHTSEVGYSASDFSVEVAISNEDGITPAILEDIISVDARDAPVIISQMDLDPDTGEILDVQIQLSGFIDKSERVRDRDLGQYVEFSCSDRGLELSRNNAKLATHAYQLSRNPTDMFLSGVSSSTTVETPWGRDKV